MKLGNMHTPHIQMVNYRPSMVYRKHLLGLCNSKCRLLLMGFRIFDCVMPVRNICDESNVLLSYHGWD